MASLRDYAWNTNYPNSDDISPGSPYCSMIRSIGTLVCKNITITGTGGEVITNVFQFDGPIELIELWAVFTDVTDVTTFSGVWFDVYDGANSVAVTSDGVDCSDASQYSCILKDRTSGNAARFLNADQVRYQESTSNRREFVGGVIGVKSGATNYLRLRVDTDANTNASVCVFMAHNCRYPGFCVEAV